LPWAAVDVSAQVSEPGIFFLAAYYNMSAFHFKGSGIPKERRYLLELSPHARDRERTDDGSSAVDARWIDTSSGLFMNVYAVRYNLTHPGGEGMLSCKDGSDIRVCWPSSSIPFSHFSSFVFFLLFLSFSFSLTTDQAGADARVQGHISLPVTKDNI
jgi:hypothetical protein